MKCIVVTPEETVIDVETDFVALPLVDGEIGIAEKHTPMIGRLGFGELRIKANDGEKIYYVESGFVEVLDDVVTLLTDRAVLASEIDLQKAEQNLATALEKSAKNEELMAMKEKTVAAARAQYHLAKKLADH